MVYMMTLTNYANTTQYPRCADAARTVLAIFPNAFIVERNEGTRFEVVVPRPRFGSNFPVMIEAAENVDFAVIRSAQYLNEKRGK
jgi:hypothetical protein